MTILNPFALFNVNSPRKYIFRALWGVNLPQKMLESLSTIVATH